MAVGAVSVTSFTPALKIIYGQTRVDNLFYKKHKLMAMFPKKEDFYGQASSMHITVEYAVPSAGRSTVFGTARTNASQGGEVRFQITRISDYQVALLDTEVIEASSNSIGALLNVLKSKVDGSLKNLARNASVMLYGNGGGARGQILTVTDVANAVVTLANTNDIVNFEVDMEIDANSTDGSTAGTRRANGPAGILAVNRSTGVITVDADVIDGAGDWEVDDYLMQEGDIGVVVTGLGGWIPATDPTATTFFSVDRSVDTERLGGVRYTGTTLPIEEALKQFLARLERAGASITHIFMNPIDAANLEVSLGTRVQYMDVTSPHATIGFKAIAVMGGDGPVPVLWDRDCPSGRAYGLDMATWKFHHLKGFPHVIQFGGQLMQRDATDQVEFRAVYRGNLATTAPGYNGTVSLAT